MFLRPKKKTFLQGKKAENSFLNELGGTSMIMVMGNRYTNQLALKL